VCAAAADQTRGRVRSGHAKVGDDSWAPAVSDSSAAQAGERAGGGGPSGPQRGVGLGRGARGAGLPSGAGTRLAAVLCGLLGQIGERMGRLGNKIWKF
jgi:hypothetical protein